MCSKRDPIWEPKRAWGGGDFTQIPLWVDKAAPDAPVGAQADPKGTKKVTKMGPRVPKWYENYIKMVSKNKRKSHARFESKFENLR